MVRTYDEREKALRYGLKSAYLMAESGQFDQAVVIAQAVINAYREGDES